MNRKRNSKGYWASLIFLLYLLITVTGAAQSIYRADICIYGATSAGIIAAYTAKKLGRSVILVTPGTHLGGLSSGGLGYTDIGNKYVVSGLALDFYRRTGKAYGKFESWIFEPHVALNVFRQYLREAQIEVLTDYRLDTVDKRQGAINSIWISNSKNERSRIDADVFIDCSYEGDLMAKAGVSYTVGRESGGTYNEQYNGVQIRAGNQFPNGIDPYRVPGDPSSGLLWGISPEPVRRIGSGDRKVQAYNYRICLSNDPANQVPITRPPGYDSSRYELALRIINKLPGVTARKLLKFDAMPNHKVDINNNGGFSTDMIGANWAYPDANWQERRKIEKEHEWYNKGLLYFLGHDLRVPDSIRHFMLQWGYPKDEYTDNGHWSPQLYIREARRMIGAYIMTEANCTGEQVVADGIGMAAYGMDSHNTDRHVIDGMVKNEGDVQIRVPAPYPIAYRSIVPRREECTNLLVPVCLSASHIAYGSIRMEPVFMVLGQSAATAAVMAANSRIAVQNINIKKLQEMLRDNPFADGRTPDMVIDDEDSAFVSKKGIWTFHKGDGYKIGYSICDTTGDAAIVYYPQIPVAGSYHCYIYVTPHVQEAADQFRVGLRNGKDMHMVMVNKKEINVSGQTSGEWVPLGKYLLKKGRKFSVRLSPDGRAKMAADAVLLVADH
ncbi:FAD-dependent oxidoreductase [Niabella sp. CC-SYL272]|uniref:FAD-dependent oxidoreductase n=1 Tax=Niabella agricola TaxID=2891571 RepID=UPI001F1A91C8|nr:FAD-dependent oxidoreductase [Niabella agricola]MCF3111258.1 FAD-dependent oxidoreductase [Niabella agricola]